MLGGTYFFTVTLKNRKASYLTEHIDLLRESMKEVKNKKPYKIDAIVILPDHIHAIWTLPENDVDYVDR
jgi:putative transposase